MKRKALTFELKAPDDGGDEGKFTATFSTLGVVDLDREITLPGAFTDGEEVRIAQWGHNWYDPPVGKGVIHSDDARAWVDGEFFLDTDHGLNTYTTVKRLGRLQEWSYGFDVLEYDFTSGDNEQQIRRLKKVKVHEVSPVMLGAAGPGRTWTDMIKGAAPPETLDVEEHADAVVAAVKAFLSRRSDLDAYLKEGRTLSTANVTRLEGLLASVEEMRTVLTEMLPVKDEDEDDEDPVTGDGDDDDAKSRKDAYQWALAHLALANLEIELGV